MEPIGKKIGGKIRTIMTKIDGLGDIEVPIGAKTIQKFLEKHYSTLSSAAGWSGIGIVEGVAMYLDMWGFSKVAQAIVDEFNLIYQNESVVTESNAFFAARAKAMEEGAEEFEFNGKKFPVTEGMNDKGEADIDFDGGAKDLKMIKKKFKVDAEEYNPGMVMLKGKKKDILAYLRSDFYGMDEDDIEELYPDLYEDSEIEVEMKAVVSEGDIARVSKKEIMFHLDQFEKGKIEAEDLRQAMEEILGEGNAFGAARAEAIAKGEDTFKVGDEEYPVEDVGADDKENAEEYAEEEGIEVKEEEVTEDEIEIKVDGDYEIEVEKEDDEEEESEEAPAEEEGEEEEVAEEGATNEAEVKSDEDFKEYAFAVLGKAFGDKFDEEKAQEVVDGLLDKHGDDYGAAVGALQSSLG